MRTPGRGLVPAPPHDHSAALRGRDRWSAPMRSRARVIGTRNAGPRTIRRRSRTPSWLPDRGVPDARYRPHRLATPRCRPPALEDGLIRRLATVVGRAVPIPASRFPAIVDRNFGGSANPFHAAAVAERLDLRRLGHRRVAPCSKRPARVRPSKALYRMTAGGSATSGVPTGATVVALGLLPAGRPAPA